MFQGDKKLKINGLRMFEGGKIVKTYPPPDIQGGKKLVYWCPACQKQAHFGLYGR